jgi:hypothetical protein
MELQDPLQSTELLRENVGAVHCLEGLPWFIPPVLRLCPSDDDFYRTL